MNVGLTIFDDNGNTCFMRVERVQSEYFSTRTLNLPSLPACLRIGLRLRGYGMSMRFTTPGAPALNPLQRTTEALVPTRGTKHLRGRATFRLVDVVISRIIHQDPVARDNLTSGKIL